MKLVLLKLIGLYQNFASPIFKQLLGIKSFCRYEQACSHYAKQQIEQEGALKGLALSLRRVLSCQSFNKSSLKLEIRD